MAAPLEQMKKQNMHGCLVQLDGKGIFITGPSGSGKTSLCLGLLETFHGRDRPASLVSDDQILIHAENGNLIGEVPASIAGKTEIFGFGIVKIDHISGSKIDLLVHLVPDEQVERMPEERFEEMLGVNIPCISAPERHENQAKRIVLAKMAVLFD